jgi:hypothetical protein
MLGTTVLVRMRMDYLRNNYQIIHFRLGWKFGQGGIGSRTRVFDFVRNNGMVARELLLGPAR